MKKYPEILQCDKRGQIVIPKDIRTDLGIDEGTGFFAYSICGEGIFLKKIDVPELCEESPALKEISMKSGAISVKKENIEKTIGKYKKVKEGKLEII
jgi:AbrB family looped-hinge helix DNA binding protein